MHSMSKYTTALMLATIATAVSCTDGPERTMTAPRAARQDQIGATAHGNHFAISSPFYGFAMTPGFAATDEFSVSMRFEMLGDNGCESDFIASYDATSYGGWDIAELGGLCYGAENDHHLAIILPTTYHILISPLTVTPGWHQLEAGRHAGHWFIAMDGKTTDVGDVPPEPMTPGNAGTWVKAFDGAIDDLQFRNLATGQIVERFNFDEGSGSTSIGVNGTTLDLAGSSSVWIPTNVDQAPGNGGGNTIDQCGTVISAPGNYVLMHDLIDCPAAGIVVNASDVTVRLKGHVIDGDNQAQPGGIVVGQGVPGGLHNVSIMGPGEIREFFWAISFEDVQQGSISDVTMDQNTFGIPMNAGFGANEPDRFSTGNVVRNNTIVYNFGHGITMNGGNGNLFANNDIEGNSGLGVFLFFGGADTVRNNVVIGNGNEGIRADNNSPESIGHVITGNTAQSNGGAGDLVDLWGDCAHNRWFGNTFGRKNPSCIQ